MKETLAIEYKTSQKRVLYGSIDVKLRILYNIVHVHDCIYDIYDVILQIRNILYCSFYAFEIKKQVK